jgi:hypothetical protein
VGAVGLPVSAGLSARTKLPVPVVEVNVGTPVTQQWDAVRRGYAGAETAACCGKRSVPSADAGPLQAAVAGVPPALA